MRRSVGFAMAAAMLLCAPRLVGAAAVENSPPDREMLRMMELLRQMEMIKQMDMMREMHRLDEIGPSAGAPAKTAPAKKPETPK